MASVDKRPNGTYRARWRDTPGGAQRTRSFTRKRDADTFLAEVQHRIAIGEQLDLVAARQSVSQWWDTWAARQTWRPGTERLTALARRHVCDRLGTRPLASLRPGDVHGLVTGMLTAGLAPGSVRVILGRLRTCLRAAVADGIVARDVTAGVTVPGASTSRLVIPTPEQAAAVFESVDDPAMRAAFLLASRAGMRRGEVLGLTVDRVTWLSSSPVVHVDRQSTHELASSPMSWSTPKTAAGVRDIPVAASLVVELSACLAALGAGPDGLVVHRDGRLWPLPAFGAAWRRLDAGFRFHDLRHLWCSTLLSAGVSPVAVARAAGHSSPTVTLNRYGHVMPSDDDRIRSASEPIEDWLRTERHSG